MTFAKEVKAQASLAYGPCVSGVQDVSEVYDLPLGTSVFLVLEVYISSSLHVSKV